MCVLIFLSLGCSLVLWYELNKKFWDIWLYFPILDSVERKPTWRSRVRWLAKLAWYYVTWKPSIEGLHDAVRTNTSTWFPFCIARYWEKHENTILFFNSFMTEIKPSVCTIILVTLCNIGIVVWTQLKVLGHFLVFSYTAPCEEETNMAIESAMTCKIGFIWRHMKTLYRVFARRGTHPYEHNLPHRLVSIFCVAW